MAASSPTIDNVKMALPEVKVGIFPGAGGTQRVPAAHQHAGRAADDDHRPESDAQRAKAMGLIHEVVAPDS